MKAMARAALAIVVFFAWTLGEIQSKPATAASADALAANGVRLFKKQRFVQASKAFEAAYARKAVPEYLYFIGRCMENLTRYDEAIDKFKAYLKAEPNTQRRWDVEFRIRTAEEKKYAGLVKVRIKSTPKVATVKLDDTVISDETPVERWVKPGRHTVELDSKDHISVKRSIQLDEVRTIDIVMVHSTTAGRLDLTCTVPGARVFLDGKSLGTTPFPEPLGVSPRKKGTLRISKAGFRTIERTVEVRPGQTTSVLAVMDEARTGWLGVPDAAWVLGGVGVTALVGGTVLVVVGFDKGADAREWDRVHGEDEVWREMDRTSRDAATAGWVTMGIGGAALVTAVVLALTNRRAEAVGERSSLRVAPSADLGGAVVRWSF